MCYTSRAKIMPIKYMCEMENEIDKVKSAGFY